MDILGIYKVKVLLLFQGMTVLIFIQVPKSHLLSTLTFSCNEKLILHEEIIRALIAQSGF